MNGKVEQNKAMKESSLLNAAYDLFTKIGIHDTTIDKIVDKAGVAKGTFYLYFKNKYDIFDRIVLEKTSALIHDAVEATVTQECGSQIDRIVFFISYVIDYLADHKLLMKIIHKNLSYSLYSRLVSCSESDGDIRKISEVLKQVIDGSIYKDSELGKILFILIEMTGSVCYSSVIDNEPAPIDVVKPVLIKTIKKMFA